MDKIKTDSTFSGFLDYQDSGEEIETNICL